VGWAIVVVVSVAAVSLALSVPSGVLAALGVGLVSAAGVHLVFGSPLGYPDISAVRDALNRVGMSTRDLRIEPDQSWGVRRLVGTTTDGLEVEVKAFGRDATGSQVMARTWRAVMYRGGGRRISFSREQAVEHEALVTIMADRAGVLVPRIEFSAKATDEVVLLVTTNPRAWSRDGGHAPEPDQHALATLWRQIADMHAAGITHGNIRADSISRGETGFVIADFGDGSLVLRDADAASDVVHLLFATASWVGAQQAVAAAATGLGPDKLATALPYLQPPALGRRERRSVEDSSALLVELREQVTEVTGAEIAEPVKLRRFGLRSILTLLVGLLFLSALVPLLTGMDYEQVWATLQGANHWLLLLALIAGQLVFVPQATAMMSAMGRMIPLRPITILQPAVAFISFAVPGVAGRMAMETAFLRNYGEKPTASVVKSAVESMAGFLVQVAILVLALVSGSLTIAKTTTDSQAASRGSLSIGRKSNGYLPTMNGIPAQNHRLGPISSSLTDSW
jgi:tRNA A-37 threonylcarbamoyl transferase component Bud32